MMKAVFYPAGDRKVASSRSRAWLLCDRRPEFFIGRKRSDWKRADAVVFQKRCSRKDMDTARKARKAGRFVVLDYSDVLLSREAGLMDDIKRLARHCHAVTTSNSGDMLLLAGEMGRAVAVVRNCQDMTAYPVKKVHGPKKRPVVVWNGHVNNSDSLGVIWPAFRLLAAQGVGFQVLLVSNSSKVARGRHIDDAHPVWYQKWRLKEVNAAMLRGDVAVNPQTRKKTGDWHKDRNKTVTAWACGLPCVDFTMAGTAVGRWADRLRVLLLDPELRARRGKEGIKRARYWGVAPVSEVWLHMLTKGVEKCRK